MAAKTYYTYRPPVPGRNVPVKKGHPLKGNQLLLKPGESAGYQQDKGYYAIPGSAPPVASVTPFEGIVTKPSGHWNMPDYASMIKGDWEVGDAEALGNQASSEAESAFQKNLRQAFVDYGGDAGKLGEYSKYIDAPTIEAARNNKFSQTAQNLAAMTKVLRQQRAAQAARGMLGSGATTQATKTAMAAREQADYGAMRDFLGGAEQGSQGLATMRQQIAEKIADARARAAARLAEQYPSTWEEDPIAAAVPAPAAPTSGWGISGGVTGARGGVAAVRKDPRYYQKLKNMRAG
jgi:hypothetical protein